MIDKLFKNHTVLKTINHFHIILVLGQFLTKMKKDEEAEILLRRAMVFYEKKYLSTKHPHLTKSIEDLGLLLLQTKQFHECEILFKKVVAAEIISYGLDSIDTYLAMTNEGKYHGTCITTCEIA